MLKTIVLAISALLLSGNALAQWQLINAESTVNFVSIKKSQIGEIHRFRTLNGAIDDGGKLLIDIDLGSVDTLIPDRDERMKTMLFNVAAFPKANIKSSIDPEKIAGMNNGDTYTDVISLNLSLHGVTQQIATDVRVVKLSKNRLLATSIKPIIISADGYALTDGIEKLREVAKLPSISTAVPVTFSVIFEQ